MTKMALKEKIFDIETRLEILKKAMEKRPDFDIDETNWKKTESVARKTRKELYQKHYGKKR